MYWRHPVCIETIGAIRHRAEMSCFTHAGRTGRAGSTGISVVLVDRKKESLIPFIERKAGLKFERIGAPQPQDVARIASSRAVEVIRVRS